MTQLEVIQNFMGSLDTDTSAESATVLDNAIKSATIFDSMQDAINNMITDCRNAGDWKIFLKEYCGINLANDDTGAITGLDAGGYDEKTAESIVPETGSLKTYKKNSFTTNGLTFTLEKNFSKLNATQKFAWQGLYTWWAEESLNLIQESYGYGFADEDALTQDITVKFYSNASDGTLAYVESGTDDDDNLELSLNINMGIFKNLDKTNKNGKSKNTDEYLDRTLAHELTHAIMAAKDNAFENLPIFMIEGIAELTCGIDDERHDEIIELAQNPDTLLSYLDMTKEEASGTEDYAAGFMFLRYIAQQSSDTTINYTDEVKITGSTKADTIYNYGSDVTINSGKGNDYIESYYSYTDEENVSATVQAVVIDGGAGKDTITTYSDNVSVNGGADNDYITSYSDGSTILGGKGNDTIIGDEFADLFYGGAGNDYLSGGDGNDKIFGDAGKDTLSGGKGNDTLKGGAGVDTFIYANGDGKDIITDYTAQDKIKITGSFTSKISGYDVIFTVGKGSLTVKNGKNKKINVNGEIYSASSSNLSEIVADKSVAAFEDYKVETTHENLITYAK